MAAERENLFKLLMADTGLLHAALEIDYLSVINQDYGSYKGYVAENIVAQELAALEYPLRYWKQGDSHSTAEIEFLIEQDGQVIPVEVKSGARSTKSKSLASFKKKFSPNLAIKLSGRPLRYESGHINAPLYLTGQLPRLIERANESR